MPENKDRNDGPKTAEKPDEKGHGTVPRTTEQNEKAAEGERFEPSPNPGHPV